MGKQRNISSAMSGVAIILIVISQLIDPKQAELLYRWLTIVSVPLLFIAAGYELHGESWLSMVRKSITTYVMPYMLTALIVIGGSELIRRRNWTYWFQFKFESLKPGVETFVFGNGWPTPNTFNWTLLGTGIIWVALAIFVGSLLFKMTDFLPINLQWLVAIMLTWGGFYLSAIIQLPWSIESAMIMQPFMMVGKQLRLYPDWKVGHATAAVGLISWFAISTAGPFDVTMAAAPHWFFTTVSAILGSLTVIYVLQRLNMRWRLLGYFGEASMWQLGLLTVLMSLFKMGGYISLLTDDYLINVFANIFITLVLMIGIAVIYQQVHKWHATK